MKVAVIIFLFVASICAGSLAPVGKEPARLPARPADTICRLNDDPLFRKVATGYDVLQFDIQKNNLELKIIAFELQPPARPDLVSPNVGADGKIMKKE